MNKFTLALTGLSVAAAIALPAAASSAATVNYNTTGSTLSCNGVAGCAQDTTTSVTLGGLTITYNTGSGSGVDAPSYINLGNVVTTGSGTSVDLTGLLLTINVNSTPPGSSGTLPNGSIHGKLATNKSTASLNFAPNNTTTDFGTLPGVQIGDFTYQVVNTTLALQAPTVGNPIGQTSIQGAVDYASATPEPATWALMMIGVGGIGGVLRTQRRKVAV